MIIRVRLPLTQPPTVWRARLPLTQPPTVWRARLPHTQPPTVWRARLPLTQPPTVWRARLPQTQPPTVWRVAEQAKDPEVQQLIAFNEQGRLPPEEDKARKRALQRSLFTVVEGVLYYVDPQHDNQKWAVVPQQHLQKRLLHETHGGTYGAHFSGQTPRV